MKYGPPGPCTVRPSPLLFVDVVVKVGEVHASAGDSPGSVGVEPGVVGGVVDAGGVWVVGGVDTGGVLAGGVLTGGSVGWLAGGTSKCTWNVNSVPAAN
jgi:hypothetical protein